MKEKKPGICNQCIKNRKAGIHPELCMCNCHILRIKTPGLYRKRRYEIYL
jgi:hypothetical protein